MRSVASTNSARSIGSVTSVTSVRSSVSGGVVVGDTIMEGESDGDDDGRCGGEFEVVVPEEEEEGDDREGDGGYEREHGSAERYTRRKEKDRENVKRKGKDRTLGGSGRQQQQQQQQMHQRPPTYDKPHYADDAMDDEEMMKSVNESSQRFIAQEKERIHNVEKIWQEHDRSRGQSMPSIPLNPLAHSSSAEGRQSGKLKSSSSSSSTKKSGKSLKNLFKSATSPDVQGDFNEGFMRSGSGEYRDLERESSGRRGAPPPEAFYEPHINPLGRSQSQSQSKPLRSALSSSVSSNQGSRPSGIPIQPQPTLPADDFDDRLQGGYMPPPSSGGPQLSTSASSGSKVKRGKSISRKASFVEEGTLRQQGKKKPSVDFTQDSKPPAPAGAAYFEENNSFAPQERSRYQRESGRSGGKGEQWYGGEAAGVDPHLRRRSSRKESGGAASSAAGGMRDPRAMGFDSQDMDEDFYDGSGYANQSSSATPMDRYQQQQQQQAWRRSGDAGQGYPRDGFGAGYSYEYGDEAQQQQRDWEREQRKRGRGGAPARGARMRGGKKGRRDGYGDQRE